MSRTGILWLFVYAAGSMASFFSPILGLVTYLFTYYSNPGLHWWGRTLPQVRWSLVISIVTVLAYIVRGPGKERVRALAHPQTKWLVGLVVISFLVTPFAVSVPISLDDAVRLAKFLVLYLLFAKLVVTPQDYRLLIIAHILGGVFWGWNATFDPHTEGGRLVNVGGPDTDTSNMTAAHLLTVLPFVGYYILAGRGRERLLCLLAAPFIINAFAMLNSRGGMVSLGIAGLAALVLAGRSHWKRTLLGVAIGLIAIYVLGGPKLLQRQATTFRYQEDHAATSRIEFWKTAVEMIKARPFGVGGHGFDLLAPAYLPEEAERAAERQTTITVHNTYLLTATTWGIPGLVCLLGYLFASLRQLHRLRATPARSEVQKRIHLESLALEIAFVGYLSAGLVSDRLYGEATYWLGGLAAALSNLWAREEADLSARQMEGQREPHGLRAGAVQS